MDAAHRKSTSFAGCQGWHGIREVYNRRENLHNKDPKKMRKQYKFAELSKEEKEYHEMILLEEVDVQAWFAIAFSSIFDEELFVTVQ